MSNVRFSDEVSGFIVSDFNMIIASGKRYFYLPWWFEEVEPGIYKRLDWDSVPKQLKDEVIRRREAEKQLEENS